MLYIVIKNLSIFNLIC